VPIRFVSAIALVAASLLLIAACGGDDSSTPEGISDVQALFEGATLKGDTVGNPDAPVEVVEYLDIQCPFCKQASEDIFPTLLEQANDDKIKVVARPVAVIGPASTLGARGAAAAAEQDAAWPFIETMFKAQAAENSGWVTEELMRNIVTDLGLDVEAWDTALAGSSEQVVNENQSLARTDGLEGVPFFKVTGPKGTRDVGQADLDLVNAAIAEVS